MGTFSLKPQLLGSQQNLYVGYGRGGVESKGPGELYRVSRALVPAGNDAKTDDPGCGRERPTCFALTTREGRNTYVLFGTGCTRRPRADSILFFLIVIFMTGFRTGVHRRPPQVPFAIDSSERLDEKQQPLRALPCTKHCTRQIEL